MSRLPTTPSGPVLRERAGRRVQPSVLAREPQRVLVVVAILSVLAHVGLVLWSWDKPIGYVDPALLQEDRTPVRVRRAAFDLVRPTGPTGDSAAEDTPDLAALSEALLSESVELPDASPPEPDLALRELEEPMPEAPAGEMSLELPAFELPESMLADLGAAPPGDLPYQGSPEEGVAAAPGGSGATEAQRLLSRAGFAPPGAGGGGGGGGGIAAAREAVRDTPALDQRLLDMPLDAPTIDFARVALDATTRLDVPEHLDHDFDYFLSRYEGRETRGYFRVDIVARRSLQKLKAMPKDVVFLIDTSSSIPQDWVRQVIRGVQQSLATLNEGDRFNIVLFNENPVFFSTDGVQPATPENLERAQRFLTGARSEGWTDVNAALSRLLVRDLAAERVYNLVLISDGKPTRGVMGTRELINLITRDNDLVASIYCVGIGRDPNRELLDFLAYRNKGFCIFVDRLEDTATTVRELMSRLRYPLIKNVQLSVVGPEISEVHPIDLPNIHQGERFSVFGRYTQPAEFTMRVTGSNAGQRVDFTFTRDLNLAPLGDRGIATGWAFWKLHHLYSEMLRQGDQPALREQIQQLRQRHNLKTLY